MKKIISLILSIVLLFGIGEETFAAVSEARTETSYVTVDCTSKVDINYEITNRQSSSFTAEISITNRSNEPISGWQLSFKGNFGISSVQNANNLRSENEFRIENNASDQPIAKGETKKFEFQGVIAMGETPVLSDFVLTSVVPYSDNAQTRMIMCFGEYIEEENSLEIYWFSTDEGAVSLYENTDNGGWEKLAEPTDEKSYKHKISGDFLEKQIRAVQKTADGTLESEPFIVARKDGKIVCEWLDSDGEGLADFAEKSFETDKQKPDTDDDGLTDYEEIYITGTDPLKSDTNGNGVNDADDDLDGDGLSNKREISLGTSPISADTDEDGLSDFDEINKHKTDPLKSDSDGDGLNDGEEIAIGLNPNKPETNGMPDSEYKVTQKISADSEAMSHVNTEESPYELSLEISATGNASTRLSANDSVYSAVTESDARLGGAVELRYLGEVDKVKLTYKIADEYIPNSGENSGKSLDLQGIKRYNIFRYFEEINMLLPVATEVDEESNTLSAETDELGTYCVLDMEVLMRNFGIEPEEVSTETVTRQMYSAPPAADINTSKSDKYCVTFVIDERDGYIPVKQINDEINKFEKTIEAENKNVKIQIVSQSLMPDWKEYIVITDELSNVIENANPYDNNYIFELYSQRDTIFEQNIAEELCQKAVEKGINISVFTPFSGELKGYQQQLADVTGGMISNGFGEFTDQEIYEYIFGTEYVAKEQLPVILATGYQPIVLDTLLYPNGENPSGVDSDTDKDGLSDWDEVMTRLVRFDDFGRCILPTVMDCYFSLTKKPFYVMNDSGVSARNSFWYSRVLPIYSDPTNTDGDFDGIDDKVEDKSNRLNNHFFGELIDVNDANYDFYVGVFNEKRYSIEYSMDYSIFFKDNSEYNSSLCNISSLYAATAYKGISIDKANYLYDTGRYYAEELMRNHGMVDIQTIKLWDDYNDTHITDVIIGHRLVTNHGKSKDVILVAIRGTGESIGYNESQEKEWSSNFDIGCNSIYEGTGLIPKNTDWTIKENHMGFDITATRVIKVINQYISDYEIDVNNAALWITGHSRGAGIANIVGSRAGSKSTSSGQRNQEYICNAYVYTFAAPRTTTINKGQAEKYDYIFNIINSDDIITDMPLESWGFVHYGKDMSTSIADRYSYSWETLTSKSYSSNQEKKMELLESFESLAVDREDCYTFHCECHGKHAMVEYGTSMLVWGSEKKKDIVPYGEPYQKFRFDGDNRFQYYRECQTTAYFMQYLSYLAAKNGDGFNIPFVNVSSEVAKVYMDSVCKKYRNTKSSFKDYSGYMVNPHEQISYYLLSKYS